MLPWKRTSLTVPVLLIALTCVYPVLLAVPVAGDSSSDIAASLIQKGDDLTLRKEYIEALEVYEAAVASDPYNSIAWNKLGIAHMNTGRYQDAVGAFDRAITIDPSYATAWTNKGDSYEKLGEYQNAVSAYDQALRLNPHDHYAFLRKGISLQESGSPGDAMVIYQEVISVTEKEVRKHPDYARFDASLWTDRGEAFFRLGRYGEAAEAYSTALAINPKYDRAIQGKMLAEEEMLRARGSPSTVVPTAEGSGVRIGQTRVSLSPSVLIGALLAALLLLPARSKKK